MTPGTLPLDTAGRQEAGARVLVVDDDPALLRMARSFLGYRGYLVDEAHSPAMARERLSAQRYTAVLTDLDLTSAGGSEGIEVVRLAARLEPRPLIVLWTGGGKTTLDSTSVRLLGADAVLRKPDGLHAFIELLLACVQPPPSTREASHART